MNRFLLDEGDYTATSGVVWERAVKDASAASIVDHGKLTWTYRTEITNEDAALKELDRILCVENAPIVVGVKIGGTDDIARPRHFVLVTGKENGRYTINDPETADPARRKTYLDEYKNLQAGTWFVLRGFIKDPPDLSELSGWAAASGPGVSVSLVDPEGRVTGFDLTSGQGLAQIRQSSQFFDSLENDVTGAPRTVFLTSSTFFSQVAASTLCR